MDTISLTDDLADEAIAGKDAPTTAEKKSENFQKSNSDGNSEELGNSDFSHIKDKSGGNYHPSTHITQSDGSPKMSRCGKFCLKKPGVKKKSPDTQRVDAERVEENQEHSDVNFGPEPVDTAHKEKMLRLARLGTEAFIMINCIIFREHGRPKTIEIGSEVISEKAELQECFNEFLQEMKAPDIHPGWMFGLTLFFYSGSRMMVPEARVHVSPFLDNLKLGLQFVWVNTIGRFFKRK